MDLRHILNSRPAGDVAESICALDDGVPSTSNETPCLPATPEPSNNSNKMKGPSASPMDASDSFSLTDRTNNMSPDSAKGFGLEPSSDTILAGTSQTSEEWQWEHIAAQRISAWDVEVERRWGHLPPLEKKSRSLAEQRRLSYIAKGPCASIRQQHGALGEAKGSTMRGLSSPVPSMSSSVMSLSSADSDSTEILKQLLRMQSPAAISQPQVNNVTNTKGFGAETTEAPAGFVPYNNASGPFLDATEPQRSNALYPNSSELFKDFLTGIVKFLLQAPIPPDPQHPQFSSKFGAYQIMWRNLMQQIIDRIEVDPHIPEFVTTPPVQAFAINFVSIDDSDISKPPQAVCLDKAGVLVKNDAGVTKANVCAAIRDYLLSYEPAKICPFPTDPSVIPKAEPMPTAWPRFVRSAVDEAGRLQVLSFEASGKPLWGGSAEIFVFCAPLTEDFVDKMSVEDNLAEALKDVKVSEFLPPVIELESSDSELSEDVKMSILRMSRKGREVTGRAISISSDETSDKDDGRGFSLRPDSEEQDDEAMDEIDVGAKATRAAVRNEQEEVSLMDTDDKEKELVSSPERKRVVEAGREEVLTFCGQ
jgi:hypothetical protein